MLMKRILPLLALSCLLAVQARADQFAIQFDFSGSSLSLLGGLLQIPPDGSITSASGQLNVGAAGLATPIPGGLFALQNFTAAAMVNAVTFGNTITGNVALNQVGPAVHGVLSAGLGNVVFAGTMHISQSGALNCAGPSCGILSLPAALTGVQFVQLGSMPIANLAAIGNALISGTFPITIAGFTGQLHLVGTEVSRVMVPEPGSAGLVAFGLAGLAAWRGRRLLRTR
jgi:hypothetical protein